MGLFDKFSTVRTQEASILSPAEAFAGILLVATAADGYIAKEEAQIVVSTLHRMQLFQGYPADHLSRMINKLMRIIQTQSSDKLLKFSIDSLPEYLHATAFSIATDIVLADGEVTRQEEAILSKLSNALRISQETVNKIIEVMIIKNKG